MELIIKIIVIGIAYLGLGAVVLMFMGAVLYAFNILRPIRLLKNSRILRGLALLLWPLLIPLALACLALQAVFIAWAAIADADVDDQNNKDS